MFGVTTFTTQHDVNISSITTTAYVVTLAHDVFFVALKKFSLVLSRLGGGGGVGRIYRFDHLCGI